MVQGYRRIFWGIFFMTFHFDIGSIQILPVFVGILIIYSGIKYIGEEFECGHLLKAARFSLLAALASFIGGLMDLGLLNVSEGSLVFVFWLAVISMSEILLFYYLLCGSVELLVHYQFSEMAQSYVKKTRGYLIVFALFTVFEVICFTFYFEAAFTAIAVLGILIRIWLLVIMNALKNTEYAIAEGEERECNE